MWPLHFQGVERRFALGKYEREHFIKLMRSYEVFCGERDVLVEVPKLHPNERRRGFRFEAVGEEDRRLESTRIRSKYDCM